MTAGSAPVLPGSRALRFTGGEPGARLESCFVALEDAIAAADSLGLGTSPARSVRGEARGRLGFAADAYVLALVGGTGVGKSSLLNALAGRIVTTAGPLRPTTARPVAWVATSAAASVAPLLERLGPVDRQLHDDQALAGLVILDLPDADSLEVANRATVDGLLPLVDAVAWVTDPEKYADALLHDELLRHWIPRLDRQVILLNKADRLAGDGVDRVRTHLARVVAGELVASGSGRPEVLAVSATHGPEGIEPFRAWLEAGLDAKAVVTGRLAASMADAALALARAGGVATEAGRRPLVDPARRRRALDAATDEALRALDLIGAERQAVAATRAQARRHGAGPLGRITSLVYRASGRERRAADPAGYLRAWRRRGTLARAVAPVTDVVHEALAGAPASLRPALAAAADPVELERRLGAAVDRVVGAQPPLSPPASRWWWLFGVLQTAIVIMLVFAVAWLLVWIVARPPVDSVQVPVLGALPIPFALLVGTLLAGLVPPRLLSLHAGWLGRRWAAGIAARLREAVNEAVGDTAFAAVDRVEASRRALWLAGRAAETGCG